MGDARGQRKARKVKKNTVAEIAALRTEIVRLYLDEQMPMQAIADRLSIGVATVSEEIHKALDAWRSECVRKLDTRFMDELFHLEHRAHKIWEAYVKSCNTKITERLENFQSDTGSTIAKKVQRSQDPEGNPALLKLWHEVCQAKLQLLRELGARPPIREGTDRGAELGRDTLGEEDDFRTAMEAEQI